MQKWVADAESALTGQPLGWVAGRAAATIPIIGLVSERITLTLSLYAALAGATRTAAAAVPDRGRGPRRWCPGIADALVFRTAFAAADRFSKIIADALPIATRRTCGTWPVATAVVLVVQGLRRRGIAGDAGSPVTNLHACACCPAPAPSGIGQPGEDITAVVAKTERAR